MAVLDQALIKAFVGVTDDSDTNETPVVVYGTYNIQGTTPVVTLDGSDIQTPVIMGAVALPGDRVAVTIDKHQATVTSNLTLETSATGTLQSSALTNVYANLYADRLVADSAFISDLTVQVVTADTVTASILSASEAQIEDLQATIVTSDVIQAEVAQLGYITATEVAATYATIATLETDYLTASDIQSTYATIATLTSDYATIATLETNYLTAADIQSTYATISNLQTNYLTATDIQSTYATIATLTSDYATIATLQADYLTATDIQSIYATIDNLETNYLTAADIQSTYATISNLQTNYLTASNIAANYMEVGFANMDTANIDKANIGILLNEVGLITSATISQGHVTGYLDAVEVNANKITAGTLVADRIAIRGSTSSIVYALNNDGTVTSQEVDTINGSAITERTITADHIVAHSITSNELTTENIASPNGYINFSTGYINIGGHLVYDANGFYLDVADELDEKIDQVADGSISFYLTQDVDTTNATTTVTAHVLRAGVDATDEFSSDYFKWFKKDDNSLEYLSYGYSVTVDNEDFDYSGSVICKFLPTVSNLVVSGSNLVVGGSNLVLYDPNGEITPSPSGGIDPEDVGDISNAIYNSTMSASSGTSITEVE